MKNEIVEHQFRFLIHTLHNSNKIFSTPPFAAPAKSSTPKSPNRSNQNTTKTIINILNSRGILVYILTSNHALYHLHRLPSLSLVHFISAIIELEVMPLSNYHRVDDENYVEEECNNSSKKRRKINCPSFRHSNYIPSILQFMERVFMNRWRISVFDISIHSVDKRNTQKDDVINDPAFFKIDQNDDNNRINEEDTTTTTTTTTKGLSSQRIEDSGRNETTQSTCIFKLWMIHLQNHDEVDAKEEHNILTNVSYDHDDDDKQDKDTKNKAENIFPILDNHKQNRTPYSKQCMNRDEEWVISISFVLAFKCLFQQVDQMVSCDDKSRDDNSNDNSSNVEGIAVLHTNSTRSTSAKKQINLTPKLALTMSRDIIITKSLQILLLLFIKGKENDEMNHVKQNLLLKSCFPQQCVKLESFVKDVYNVIAKDDIEKERNDDDRSPNTSLHAHGENDCLELEQQQKQEAIFDKLWDEMLISPAKKSKEIEDHNDGSAHEPKSINEATPDDDIDASSYNIPMEISKDVTAVVPEEKRILDKNVEEMVLDLRLEFFVMGQNATSNVINDMTQKTSDLLQKAGKEKGAVGIKEVATLLKYGDVESKEFEGERNQSMTENNRQEQETSSNPCDDSMYYFPDVFIASLCKACITQETSAVRTSMIMSEFVLPSIVHLKTHKARAASRALISTISFLANDRPAECASSLLVPALCSKRGGDNVDEKKIDVSNDVPNKAQCELVSKIVKQAKWPKGVLGKIIADLTMYMTWNEQTVPVLTTCLQKKPQLCEETISLVVKRICSSIKGGECDGDKDVLQKESIQNIRKGMKFSTLFHTFVTKHGSQIRNRGAKDELLSAAGLLKTILGKSICASLKKL